MGHTTKVKQYEILESKKAATRENNGTISDKETLELKLMSIYQVVLGSFFRRKDKKKY